MIYITLKKEKRKKRRNSTTHFPSASNMNDTDTVGTCLTSIPDFEYNLFGMDLENVHHLCECIHSECLVQVQTNDMLCMSQWCDGFNHVCVEMKSRCLFNNVHCLKCASIRTSTRVHFIYGFKRNKIQ